MKNILGNYELTFGISLSICSVVTTSWSDLRTIPYGDVATPISCSMLIVLWRIRIHNYRYNWNQTFIVVLTRSPCAPFLEFSSSFCLLEICGNILNTFWGGIETTKILYFLKLRLMGIHCLDRNSGLCMTLYFIGSIWNWFQIGWSFVECGSFWN